MKKRFLLIASLLALSNEALIAQQVPTGTPPANITGAGLPDVRDNAQRSWYRGGNPNIGNGAANNIFGTLWNSPIYTVTNGVNRTKLNGNFTFGGPTAQYTINGYGWLQGVNTSGYMLLGFNNTSITDNSNIYTNKGAFSLLHLNGPVTGSTALTNQYQEFGYRPWMKTGVTFTDNRDLSYMGLRQVGTGLDATETVIGWSDQTITGQNDEIAFRFFGNPAGTTTIDVNDLLTNNDLDGLNVARYTADGRYALGNTFGYNNVVGHPLNVYVSPASLFHMSYQYRSGDPNEPFGFMQITYRRQNGATQDTIGQGEQVTDGLRLGIDNNVFGAAGRRHLNAYLRWQEASSFVIQTEDNNTPNIEQTERIRITSIGALNRNYLVNQYNGLTTNENVTRVAISHLGNAPLTRPKSLLHIGYDYGNPPIAAVQGYRQWMDLGMLVSNSRDHVWLGLLPRDTVTSTVTQFYERNDAVLAWGTDRNVLSPLNVDNMRFVFTGSVLDAIPEISPSNSNHGLEMMRMYPATVYQHYLYDANGNINDSVQAYGRVGIGDFTWSGVDEEPTEKLDVVGNGRFRYLPDSTYMADSLVNKIVMVDSMGVLRWKSFVPSEFGTNCADTVNGKLNADKKVVLNNHSLYFTNHPDSMDFNENKVNIGYDCGVPTPAKFSVLQKHDTIVTINSTAISGINKDTTNSVLKTFIGVQGQATQHNLIYLRPSNYGGKFEGGNATLNYGVFGSATSPKQIGESNFGVWGQALDDSSATNNGGNFQAAFGSNNVGVSAVANGNLNPNPNGLSYGVNAQAQFNLRQNAGVVGRTYPNFINNYYGAQQNFGVGGLAGGADLNIGIYGEAATTTNTTNYAGYFVGSTVFGGSIIIASDSLLKENIEPLPDNFDSLLMQLHPYQYEFKTTGDAARLGAKPGIHYGVLAQEVASLFPQVVVDVKHPAELDSVGNIINPSFNYKAIDFVQLLPLMLFDAQKKTATIQGIQNQVSTLTDSLLNHNNALDSLSEMVENQQTTIDSQQTTINDLNNRLTNLENCLSALLPTLCQMNQSAVQANTPAAQEAVRQNLQVTLSNRSTIILDQNVPNPFAEQTVINFSIPASVAKAQMHFYDGNGRLIQTLEIAERGLGAVTVFGSDLSSGTYTYTLVADGAVVATKKMMKQ